VLPAPADFVGGPLGPGLPAPADFVGGPLGPGLPAPADSVGGPLGPGPRTLPPMPEPAASPASESVLVQVDDGVARVLLHQPARRNALGLETLTALIEALAAVGGRPDVRVIVLGADGPAFSAGHDIAEMVDRDEAFYRELFSTCTTLMNLLRQLGQPVIAQVDGVATAAGCQLVAGCDLAVASERATFAMPGVRIGLFCSTPLVPVSRAIGPKRALEMLLTAEPIDAATAQAWGLVNRVVPVGELDAAVGELAAVLRQWSPQIIELGKLSFYEQLGLSERSAYEVMSEVMTANALLPDAQEGFRAFVAKRSPVWGS
jgi:enoyl-CoA hydratase/carnithine racemase